MGNFSMGKFLERVMHTDKFSQNFKVSNINYSLDETYLPAWDTSGCYNRPYPKQRINVTITLPSDEFSQLLKITDTWVTEYKTEIQLRTQYPAINKAYQNYKILIDLTKDFKE